MLAKSLLSKNEKLPLLAFALVGIFFFAIYYRPVLSGDIWFLLLAGQYALDHAQVPHHEFFIYSGMGAPQIFGGWGFGVLAELARRLGGLGGISSLNAALWSATLLIAIMAARQSQAASKHSSLPELVAGIVASALLANLFLGRSHFRPEVTAYLLWCFGLFLFEKARREQKFGMALVFYPALLWLEAWFHTAGPILLLIIVGYGSQQAYDEYARAGRLSSGWLKHRVPWLASFTAGLLLPALNPNGLMQNHVHLALFIFNILEEIAPAASLRESAGLAHTMIDTKAIGEFLPIWAAPQFHSTYLLLASLSVIVWLFQPKMRIVLFFTIFPLSLVALFHIRGLGLWALALLVPLTMTLAATGRLLVKPGNMNGKSHLGIGGLLAVLMAAQCVFARNNGSLSFVQTPPLRNAEAPIRDVYPSGGNIFTSLYMGAETAFALGPGYRVSFAGHITYRDAGVMQHFNTVSSAADGWENELSRYNARVVVSEPVNAVTGAILAFPATLIDTPAWRPVAQDSIALTFIKQPDEIAPEQKRLDYILFWSSVVDQISALGSDLSPLASASLRHAQRQLDIARDSTMNAQEAIIKLRSNAILRPRSPN